ncbi:MAG TPA: AAA family ATPase [Fibrobacter sp.]|nr:AAA family ATPase [Fibrobacter sp.]
MEDPKNTINQFLKTKHNPKDVNAALFKAAEAAMFEGWTYMEATFQLGTKAQEDGLSQEESESIMRRAFASEKRTKERVAESVEQTLPPQASPSSAQRPSSYARGMIPLEQVLAMGLDTQSIELLQNHRIDPEALSIPWPSTDWRKDLAKLVEVAFAPEETIEFKMSDTPETTSEKISNIVNQSDAIKKIMKSLDSPEGALISINVAAGAPDAANESWRYRYVVVDNPKMTLAKQLAYYKALNLPCIALINTGANSVQAWVKINAADLEEYNERVDFLFSTLEEQGFPVSSSNKNATQMVRMPGVLRNGKQQYLIGLEQGAKNFLEWKEWVEYFLDGKPLIELASDSEKPPKKEDPLIQNTLRVGEFMLLTAPQKSGKSFALMDLALSICYGEEWLGSGTTTNDVLFINFEFTKATFLNRLHLIANKRNIPATTSKLGFLNLRGMTLSPLEIAQLIAKRIEGAKKLENHDYKVVIIDPIASVLHNPKAMRTTGPSHQILMQMVDTIIALTGSAVVTASNTEEFPYLETHADSVISLKPMEGSPNVFQIHGAFREFSPFLAKECSWIFPRFIV